MKVSKLLASGFIAWFGLSATSCTRSHRKASRDRGLSGWAKFYIANTLDLNDAQKQKFEALEVQSRALGSRLEREREQLRSEFAVLIGQNTFDMTKARALVERSQALISEESSALLPMVADTHSSLDAKQKLRLAELLREHGHD